MSSSAIPNSVWRLDLSAIGWCEHQSQQIGLIVFTGRWVQIIKCHCFAFLTPVQGNLMLSVSQTPCLKYSKQFSVKHGTSLTAITLY